MHHRRFSDKIDEKEINEESCNYNIATPFDTILSHINFLYYYTKINYLFLGSGCIVENIIFRINYIFKHKFFFNEIKYEIDLRYDYRLGSYFVDNSKYAIGCFDCFVFVYDISIRISFDKVIKLLKVPQWKKNDFFIYILYGNKPFYDFKREVSFEEGKKLAEENKMIFFEIDMYKNDDIKQFVEKSVKRIADYRIKKYYLNAQK